MDNDPDALLTESNAQTNIMSSINEEFHERFSGRNEIRYAEDNDEQNDENKPLIRKVEKRETSNAGTLGPEKYQAGRAIIR